MEIGEPIENNPHPENGVGTMLISERMSKPVITIHPDMPMQDALELMRKEHIRRLPVVDKHGRLIVIVSEGDLLHVPHQMQPA